jgi:putative ABC transport system permease protein
MIKNYFKIAFRTFVRNKVFSFVNITGLALGLTCCMLILLYGKDEVSFDRFHKKQEQLFQLTCHRVSTQGEDKHFAIAAMVQGPAFKQEIPEIEAFVRVNKQEVTVKKDGQVFTEKVTWTDANFFSVFSFPLLTGSPTSALSDLHSVVLTYEMAEKYFGTAEAIGKTIELEMDGKFEPFVVTGIAKKAPQNSSIKFNMLLPFKYLETIHPDNGWMWVSYPTYFLLNPKANTALIETKMAAVFATQAQEEIAMNTQAGYHDKFIWGLQPFVQMHLNAGFEGAPEVSNPLYTYLLTGIALFILLIACINFINLTIAQSLKRGKEIGIRKVIGSQRNQLIKQFLGESLFVCFIAFSLAILWTKLILPVFNELANKQLSLSYLFDFQLVATYFLLFLITGMVAGFYPALVLSNLQPVETLYKKTGLASKNYLAKGLVVLQFSIASFLIIVTLFIYAQFDYLTKTDLGYNDKNLLEMTVPEAIMNKPLMDVFKSEFSKTSGIEAVSYRNEGHFGGKTKVGNKELTATYMRIDDEYLNVLQVPLVAGRYFSKDFPADSTNSVVVNEAFVKEADWQDPIGKTIDFMNFPDWGNRKITVVGVVKDYHDQSLKEKIKPVVFTQEARLPLGKFAMRIKPTNVPQTLAAIEKTYQKLSPFHPFQYDFKADLNDKSYEAEAKWKQIITFSAIVTIFISCIGLFGLSLFSIQKRLKEVGIRKVFGASVQQIVGLISFDFIKLVLLAFLIATPLAWFSVNKWLQNFAYRVDMSWQVFALAGILALAIALVTVSYNAIKAAILNPIHSLKNE